MYPKILKLVPTLIANNTYCQHYQLGLKNNSFKPSFHIVSSLAICTFFSNFPTGAAAQIVVPPSNGSCVVIGTTATCSGDVTVGIDAGGNLTELNVKNITQTIAPGVNINGIDFLSPTSGDVTVNVETGTFGISTTGVDADGLQVIQNIGAGNANLGVFSNGDITTNGNDSSGIISTQDGGDGNILVHSSGTIKTLGDDSAAISATQNFGHGDVSVFSKGHLTTFGNNSLGVVSTQDSGDGAVSVQSNGSVSTSGDNAKGIAARQFGGAGSVFIKSIGDVSTSGFGSGAVSATRIVEVGDISVDSTGDISTLGNASAGIFAVQAGGEGSVSVKSSGNIQTQGTVSYGIIAAQNTEDGDISVISEGNISTLEFISHGIFARQLGGKGDISVFSKGNILAEGADAAGISAENTGDTGDIEVTSFGSVTSKQAAGINVDIDASGKLSIDNYGLLSGETGILVEERDMNAAATISNAGTISGADEMAINLQGDGNDTVVLLGGSKLNGSLDFGNGNDGIGGSNSDDIDTLITGTGVNALINFVDASGTDSDLESSPENIITAGASALLNDGKTLLVVDPSGFAAANITISDLSSSLHNVLNSKERAHPHDDDFASNFWVYGFGGNSEGSGSHISDIKNGFGGLIAGVETERLSNGIWGAFGGTSSSDLKLEFNQSATGAQSIFGGVYYKNSNEKFYWEMALAIGHSSYDSIRNLNGGASSSNFSGWFYSPSLTLGVPLNFLEFSPGASLSGRISYTGLSLDSYQEIGGLAPLMVQGRHVGVFGARAQLNLPKTFVNDNGTATKLDLALGLDTQIFDAENVSAIANVGNPTYMNFGANTRDRLSAFASVGLSFTSANKRNSLSLSGELHSDFNHGIRAAGGMKAKFKF